MGSCVRSHKILAPTQQLVVALPLAMPCGRSKSARNKLRGQAILPSDFKLIWVVQSGKKKYSTFHFGKSELYPSPSHPRGGALAIVTKRWDGMRWTRQRRARLRPDENADRVRRSRVVLAPRCWRQVDGSNPAGDGDNKPAHRGERDISRKAIAQGMSECFRSPVCSCAPF